jgi:hypothetical protein
LVKRRTIGLAVGLALVHDNLLGVLVASGPRAQRRACPGIPIPILVAVVPFFLRSPRLARACSAIRWLSTRLVGLELEVRCDGRANCHSVGLFQSSDVELGHVGNRRRWSVRKGGVRTRGIALQSDWTAPPGRGPRWPGQRCRPSNREGPKRTLPTFVPVANVSSARAKDHGGGLSCPRQWRSADAPPASKC